MRIYTRPRKLQENVQMHKTQALTQSLTVKYCIWKKEHIKREYVIYSEKT